MNIILQKFFEYATKDLYSFADYDLPEFRKALESYKTKHRMTSAPSKKIRRKMDITKMRMPEGIVYKAVHKTYRSKKSAIHPWWRAYSGGAAAALGSLPATCRADRVRDNISSVSSRTRQISGCVCGSGRRRKYNICQQA